MKNSAPLLYLKIMMTGGIILGLELASSKIMTPFFGVSINVWASILAVTLVALAIGYKAGGVLTHKLSYNGNLLFFITSGALASIWINITLWTYPFVFTALSGLSLVTGSIAACIFTIFIPLVILSALNPVLVSLLNEKTKGDGDFGAGTVMFVSTLGSVAGVFITTYAMLPYLSNYDTITLMSLAAATLSLSLHIIFRLFKERGYTVSAVLSGLTLLVALATLLTGGHALSPGHEPITHKNQKWSLLHAEPSNFSGISIVDVKLPNNLTSRLLLTDGLLQNSFLRTAYGDMLPYNLYTYVLERMALAVKPDAANALILGLGAGVIPMELYYKGLEVDVVEIDPKVVDMAVKFLEFERSSISTLYTQDARTAIRNCAKSYDIVAVDLFSGDGLPEHLVTQEFFADIKSCLSKDGVLVMNSFTDPDDKRSHKAIIKTLSSVMGEVFTMASEKHKDGGLVNGFLAAQKSGHIGLFPIPTDNLPAKMEHMLIDYLDNTQVFTMASTELNDAPILSDNKNNWKLLIQSAEKKYRKTMLSNTPWQILVN